MHRRSTLMLLLFVIGLLGSGAGQWLHGSIDHHACSGADSTLVCSDSDEAPTPVTPEPEDDSEDCPFCQLLHAAKSQLILDGAASDVALVQSTVQTVPVERFVRIDTRPIVLMGRAPPAA